MDDKKWQLLNQLLEDLSEVNSDSVDLTRLVSQLVLELVSEPTCTTSMSSQLPSLETYWTNHQEELA